MNGLHWLCWISIFLFWIAAVVFIILAVKLGHDADEQRWDALSNMVKEDTITSGCPVIKE